MLFRSVSQSRYTDKEKIHPEKVRITLPMDVFELLDKKKVIIYEQAPNGICGSHYFQSQYGRVSIISNIDLDKPNQTIIDIHG